MGVGVAAPSTAEPSPAPPRTPRLAAASGLLAVLLVAIATLLPLVPAAAAPATAAATDFSADRAKARLPSIAGVAHPAGSPAQEQVRAYLLGQLRELGLDPQVLTTSVARESRDGALNAGTVSDVHARIRGTAATGTVLLVAHYDSVPVGPGASDNGSNVATVLEVVRALLASGPPRNDVVVLFTDGEEQGLLGAHAYAASGLVGDPTRTVVLNLEARGVSGPVIMFQALGAGLTPAVAASGTVTTSLAGLVYQLLPNDTDLSALHEVGMRGLNFAYVGGVGHYHTRHDDVAHNSSASMQDMGDSALATARYLDAADLGTPEPDGTYFSLFGGVVTHPAWVGLAATVLAAIGFPIVLWRARRRLALRGIAVVAATLPLCVAAGAALTAVMWSASTAARPEFGLLLGGIYGSGPYALAEGAVLLALLLVWRHWVRRRADPLEIALGVVGWYALLAVGAAMLAPNAAYVFAWPALVGVVAAAIALGGRGRPAGRSVAAAAPAVVATALTTPIVVLLVPPLSTALTIARLLLAMLLVAVVLAVVPAPARRWRAAAVPAAIALAGVTALVVITATDGRSVVEPRPVSLGYVLETDTGTATWVSRGGPAQPVVGPLLTGDTVRFDARIPQLGGQSLQSGPAPATGGPAAPRAEVLASTEEGDVRTVRVRIVVPREAYSIALFADLTGHEIVDGSVDGAALPGGRNLPDTTAPWGWGFGYAAPPPSGVELVLRSRGTGPLRVQVVATTVGLPAAAPPLPPELIQTAWPSVSGQSFVASTFAL